jgi:2-oxo-3-(phosphooxy)propyl 3-oxoalkanoate synthase
MTLLTVQTEERTTTTPGRGPYGTGELPQLTTTVPREYVHRASLAEVFLTGCKRTDDTRFFLTGQWPRAHALFVSPDGHRHDPLQAAETIRQAGMYVAHAELGIPLGTQFVMWDLSVTTVPEQMLVGPAPAELSIEAVSTRPDGHSRRANHGIQITIRRAGELCATGEAHFSCLSPAAYRRLRGARHTAPPAIPPYDATTVSPPTVGLIMPNNVVLAATGQEGRWLLRPPVNHPLLFDHGCDHIPGMVLLEAARQATYGLLGPGCTLVPASVATEFNRYAEFDAPCWIQAEPLPAHGTDTFGARIAGIQDGKQVFRAEISGQRNRT